MGDLRGVWGALSAHAIRYYSGVVGGDGMTQVFSGMDMLWAGILVLAFWFVFGFLLHMFDAKQKKRGVSDG